MVETPEEYKARKRIDSLNYYYSHRKECIRKQVERARSDKYRKKRKVDYHLKTHGRHVLFILKENIIQPIRPFYINKNLIQNKNLIEMI